MAQIKLKYGKYVCGIRYGFKYFCDAPEECKGFKADEDFFDDCANSIYKHGFLLERTVKSYEYEPELNPMDEPYLKIGRMEYGMGTQRGIEKLWIDGELIYPAEGLEED